MACFEGAVVDLQTCKTASDFYGDFPPEFFEDATPTGMCIRSLVWHKTRYDASEGKIFKTDSGLEVGAGNRDFCFRHTRWCGLPSLRSERFGAQYIDSEQPPAQRPLRCACWDLTVSPPWPTSGDDFTFEDVGTWIQYNCQPVADPLWGPVFSLVTTWLASFGAQYDGWRVAIMVLVNTEKWMIIRRNLIAGQPPPAPYRSYPEASAYTASVQAMAFPQESVEACLWDTETEDLELGCP